MQRRIVTLLLSLLSLLLLVPALPARAEPLCFPEAAPTITDCIDERIGTFWEEQGGLPVFGYPLTPLYAYESGQGTVRVQLFERARLELHPDNDPPYDVQLGLLGRDALQHHISSDGALLDPQPPQEGCRFFAETRQSICPPFLQFWSSYGLELGDPGISPAESLALFGLPLTPPQSCTVFALCPDDGPHYTVQWFERARFEDHGDEGVLLGLLGRELAAQPSAAPVKEASPADEQTDNDTPDEPPVPTAPPPAASLEPGGFVTVSGTQLTRLGQPVLLKGVNYYPQWRPWAEMWHAWDANQIEHELQTARDELGINTVRVLLPYDLGEAKAISRLREIVQIAGDLDMRVMVALFDFHNSFPPANSEGEYKHFKYLRSIIGNFAGDDRILAWDLHNEPDHYETWTEGNAEQVLGWLGRMADEIHRIAPNHLVTVGMGQYNNVWQRGPDGRRVIDYSDIISIHNYNAPDTERQLYELRQHTDKPIILQEFGWPSGPTCQAQNYTEAQQAEVYRQMIDAALSEGADGTPRTTGIIAWTLRDYDPGPTIRWDSREEHYGLYRPDGTLKPAAQAFGEVVAAPLPSNTKTSLPLTREDINEPGGPFAPKLFEGNDYYVKGWFRLAWEQFQGRDNFGRPMGEAFIRPADERIVHYFQAIVLEWQDERMGDPSFPKLTEEGKIKRTIQPVAIGNAYAAAHSLAVGDHDVSDTFEHFYETLPGGGEWRMGEAITSEMTEDINGVSMTVQYFEHGRLELNPVSGAIQIGLLGSWYWEMNCHPAE